MIRGLWVEIGSDKIDDDSVVSRSKEWGNLSQSVQYCLEKVPSVDSHILDIGCNTGSLIYNLSLRGFKHVYGIDIEENKIEEGRLIYPELVDNLLSVRTNISAIYIRGALKNNAEKVAEYFDFIEETN